MIVVLEYQIIGNDARVSMKKAVLCYRAAIGKERELDFFCRAGAFGDNRSNELVDHDLEVKDNPFALKRIPDFVADTPNPTSRKEEAPHRVPQLERYYCSTQIEDTFLNKHAVATRLKLFDNHGKESNTCSSLAFGRWVIVDLLRSVVVLVEKIGNLLSHYIPENILTILIVFAASFTGLESPSLVAVLGLAIRYAAGKFHEILWTELARPKDLKTFLPHLRSTTPARTLITMYFVQCAPPAMYWVVMTVKIV